MGDCLGTSNHLGISLGQLRLVETLGVFNASARHLLADLGKRISVNTGEARETSYLYPVQIIYHIIYITTLFCCITVCRPLTAQTIDRTQLCIQCTRIAYSILKLPRDNIYQRSKKDAEKNNEKIS